jgi:hypothetical protein
MKTGPKPKKGTDQERKQVQVRIPKIEVEEVERAHYFGFGDLSKYIMSLWADGLAKNRTKDLGEVYKD